MDRLIEAVEGPVVSHAPLAHPLGKRKIAVGSYPAIPRAEEIALHIGEVDVSAIEHVGCISFFAEALGYGGEGLALGGILHDGCGGLRRIAVQYSNNPPVGTERVGIHIGEGDALTA